MVRSKEEQNARLQASLEEKQKEADSIVADVNVQVDRLLSDVKMNMANLEGQIKQQIRNNEGSAAEQSQEVKNTLEQMLKGLDGRRHLDSHVLTKEAIAALLTMMNLVRRA